MLEDGFECLYLQQNHSVWKQELCFCEMFLLRLIMGLTLKRRNQNKTDVHPSAHANSAVITSLRDYPDIFT